MQIIRSQHGRVCGALGLLALLAGGPAVAQGYTITDLGTLGPLGTMSAASGINDHGQVVGSAGVALIRWEAGPYGDGIFTQPIHAFLWQSGAMTDLVAQLGVSSYASAVSSDGRAAGEATLLNDHAALWENGGLFDLGTLGGQNSQAFGVNAAGQVVGQWEIAHQNGPHAFLWENGVMQDLNALLPPRSGWELFQATGINNAGQIVGSGNHYATLHAFLMTPRPAGGV